MKKTSAGIVVASIYAAILSYGIAGVQLSTGFIVSSIVKHNHPGMSDKQMLGISSTYQSIGMAVTAGCCFFFLSFLGRCSDFYGRKPIVLASAVMLLLATIAMVAAYYLNMMWLYILSSIFMITEGLAQVAGFSYVTDISECEADKSKNFGVIVATSVIGVVGGSFLTGLLLEKNFYISFLVLLVLCVVDIVFLVIFFKEMPVARKMEKKELVLALNPFRALVLLFTTNPFLTWLVLAYGLFNMASADTNTDYLYTEYKFGWGSRMNGMAGAANALATIVFQFIGIRITSKFLPEQWALTFVLLISAGINVCYGLVTRGWMFLAINAVAGFATIFIPMCEAQMSNQCEQSQQGAMFGGIISINFIAQFVGDLALENSFSLCMRTKGFFTCPGTPFYIGALLLFIAFCICLVLYLRFPPKPVNSNQYVPIKNVNEDGDDVYYAKTVTVTGDV
eukprot:Phypoly_transcript_07059.p1 GENE.Phypoly_transcript_07059~~Phypoly_transcript_07059.p1  ORF type:complete len:451 (+),score=52.72 Phypoly_transcript_07059:313-1665(+)